MVIHGTLALQIMDFLRDRTLAWCNDLVNTILKKCNYLHSCKVLNHDFLVTIS